MKKSISKSVRMTKEVFDYVNNFEGDGFNQKFSNLVLFCMKEEDSKRKIISDLSQNILRKRSVLENFIKLENSLYDLLAKVHLCSERSKYVESLFNDLSLCYADACANESFHQLKD